MYIIWLKPVDFDRFRLQNQYVFDPSTWFKPEIPNGIMVQSHSLLWLKQGRSHKKKAVNRPKKTSFWGGPQWQIILPYYSRRYDMYVYIKKDTYIKIVKKIRLNNTAQGFGFHGMPLNLHPGRLTWNLQITHLKRKIIFQTSMSMFHVNLPGRTLKNQVGPRYPNVPPTSAPCHAGHCAHRHPPGRTARLRW